MNEVRFDALLPAEMATRAEYLGVQKAETGVLKTFALSVLAGGFIALGSVFATTTAAGTGSMPFGAAKLMTGLVFCLGLVLVVVAGAELFTGNNLIVMAWASRKVSTQKLLRNWAIVYAGNFVGSVGMAVLVFLSRQYGFGGGAVGETALKIAAGKVTFGFIQAVSLGTLCNTLVCLAVWLTFSARTTVDKIVAIIFPVTAFVAAGFEHSIANMYFIPFALLIKQFDPAFVTQSGVDVVNLTWGTFLVNNLIPVTLGNIIGGAALVSATYWAIFLRARKG
ncbi:MAG TPA: formate transporter FocA [Chloroflexi bacterium]|nr:formate transporter FocA [Chloroflexota bacterium]